MDDDQTPLPAKPWVTRSAWSLAPALFFYELSVGFIWLVVIGTLFDVGLSLATFLPVIGYFVFRMGQKCSMEETKERVPRGRIWGTSVMVSLVIGVFAYVLFQDLLFDEMANNPQEFAPQMAAIFSQSNIPQETLDSLTAETKISMVALSFSLFLVGVSFILHLTSLWFGVRSIERRAPAAK